jgi:hypothetical protein
VCHPVHIYGTLEDATQAASFNDSEIQLKLLCLSHQFDGVEKLIVGIFVSATHGSCKKLYVQVR